MSGQKNLPLNRCENRCENRCDFIKKHACLLCRGLKKLLNDSGSNALRIRDVFKTHNLWGEIIDSDKRGNYRLKEGLIVNLE